MEHLSRTSFQNADEAFRHLYEELMAIGFMGSSTRYIMNRGFYILDPCDNEITCEARKWSKDYAMSEWAWYLSGDPYVTQIKKIGKIWDKMHSGDDRVNSNYGYHWLRNDQLRYVINELSQNPESRRAVITLYDGKEHGLHSIDTPCTLNIGFNTSEEGKLDMTVTMRSNDIWFGFCNDQFCFSMLQALVASKLGISVGSYYHFVINLHLYHKQAGRL